eukprot:512560_1
MNLDPLESRDEILNDIHKFDKIFPWRLCFAGGWLDLMWCNEIMQGSVITINVKHNKHFKDRAGLATSSRKIGIKLWNGARKINHLTPLEAARLLWGAENMESFMNVNPSKITAKYKYIAGSQDHCGLFLPGINNLYYNGSHWPKKIISLNDPIKYNDIYRWLESVLYLVEIPFEGRPKGYSSQKINYLKDTSVSIETKRKMVKDLSDASALCWDGIINKNIKKLGMGLTNTMYAWQAMLPATVPNHERLTKFWKKYEKETYGCLFSGAGGGFLFVISDKDVPNGFKIQINNEYYITKEHCKSSIPIARNIPLNMNENNGALVMLDSLITTFI